jgi:LCP family protein required for cell wall assembly
VALFRIWAPMRTTLKRGLGQGASVNGNGRAVLPPTAPTPMTVYQQPPPARRSRVRAFGRFFFILLIAVVMLACALAGGLYLAWHQGIAAIQGTSVDIRKAKTTLNQVPPPGHAAILMTIGYDRRPDEANNTPSRSDTIMLLRTDPKLHAISMLSFPRDLLVTIHCPGQTPYQDKINAAYSDCGSKGTVETIRALTGLPINYLVTVNFTGFKEIVDHLGGVWIDVDHRYLNTNGGRSYDTYATINLWPGYQKLNGWQALDYVRFRHTDSDLLRVIRQQQFVRALKERIASKVKVTDPTSYPTVAKIIGSIERNVEAVQGGGGDISGKTVFRYAVFALGLPAGHFFQDKIQGLDGYSYLTTDPSNIADAVNQFTHPDVDAPGDTTNVLFGGKPKVPTPAETSVIVLNGNGVEHSASTAGDLLAARGYKVLTPGPNQTQNAPNFNYQNSIVYWNPAVKRSKAAARRVAELFAPATAKKLPPTLTQAAGNAMLLTIVGHTFHGTIATPPPHVEPKKEPPAVTYSPDVTLPLVRAERKRLPFRLEYPLKIENTSIPDPEVPSRVYRLDKKHKALRLTFRTGARNYWGIEEMDYDKAPVLSERNFRRFIGKREFDLYFSGGHLHMVVLRKDGATYWVINTLDDALSNDTMLAIARSLRPLKGKVGRA